MLKKEYPDEGELVIGTVAKVENFGAFITLDEFPGKEGFIHIAEIATGWVKRIRNHIKEKQKVVCKVTNVDTHKQHIDLSLKRVNEHQKRDKIQEWKNSQKSNITIPFVNIKGYIKLTCWVSDGITHIRYALNESEKSEYEDVEIRVKYIGAPNYI